MSGIKTRGGHVRVRERSQVICGFGTRNFCKCAKCPCASVRRNAQSSRQSERSLSELPHSERWKPIRGVPEFDHNQTKYPLRGMHQSVTCTQCHVRPVFTSVGQRCQDCHADIHRRQLGANCEQCHSVQGWQVSIPDPAASQPLSATGAHAAVDCDSCHKGAATGKFQITPTQCYSCHAQTSNRPQIQTTWPPVFPPPAKRAIAPTTG